MLLGCTVLSAEQCSWQLTQGLYLYSGRKKSSLNQLSSASCKAEKLQALGEKGKVTLGLTLPFPSDKFQVYIYITLTYKGHLESSQAFVDSGAAGNFLKYALAIKHQIPLLSLPRPMKLISVDGQPILGSHICKQTV